MKPNLFDYATSELSQDAFLCWLTALAGHDDGELQLVGRAFIAWLWERARGARIQPDRIRLLEPPKRQVDRIDILFEAEIAGVKALFLIEDKTETSHHSRQLERYLDATKHAETVVPIYFKTGYHFGSDTSASAAGYTVIGLPEWAEFLDQQTVRNDILADYRAYIRKLLSKRQEGLRALMTPRGFDFFTNDFVQYEFMQLVAAACPEHLGKRSTYRGRSLSGEPWTQHLFAVFEGVLPGGLNESLFYRVDRRREGWYLAARQYAKVDASKEARTAKLARLRVYRELFEAAAQEVGASSLFARPSTDNRGKNESEFAVLFFSDAGNTPSNVLERIPSVHRAFISKIANGLAIS